MGQLERGSKDENDCPVLGDWLCLGKTQGCPGSSPPRGGEAHSRHRRRRVGTSTRSPRSPGTARWSWPWLERWTSGCRLFHRAWKRRLGLERGFGIGNFQPRYFVPQHHLQGRTLAHGLGFNVGPVGVGYQGGLGNGQLGFSGGLGWQGRYAHFGYPANYNRFWTQQAPGPIFHTDQLQK